MVMILSKIKVKGWKPWYFIAKSFFWFQECAWYEKSGRHSVRARVDSHYDAVHSRRGYRSVGSQSRESWSVSFFASLHLFCWSGIQTFPNFILPHFRHYSWSTTETSLPDSKILRSVNTSNLDITIHIYSPDLQITFTHSILIPINLMIAKYFDFDPFGHW